MLAGLFCLPDVGNKTFRPCYVRGVFVAKLLEHHPLLRTDTKREEDSKCDQVRRTCHPFRDDERVGNGIKHQRRAHRVANPAIDALRDESMLLAYLQRDRPVRAKVRGRPQSPPAGRPTRPGDFATAVPISDRGTPAPPRTQTARPTQLPRSDTSAQARPEDDSPLPGRKILFVLAPHFTQVRAQTLLHCLR